MGGGERALILKVASYCGVCRYQPLPEAGNKSTFYPPDGNKVYHESGGNYASTWTMLHAAE